MKEDFLHYVWKFQKFDATQLRTIAGAKVEILDPGKHNLNAGPDFFNAQLRIDGQRWAGNVEIHVAASDWYAHKHQNDDAYNSVVLHVVWEYDREVYRNNGDCIPTISLQKIVAPQALRGYQQLLENKPKFISCEAVFPVLDAFRLQSWLEYLYLERLEQKVDSFSEILHATSSHWEATLFYQLCKNFGSSVNGSAFQSIGRSVPFSIILKCKADATQLEALLLGQAGLLEAEFQDAYPKRLQKEYAFLRHKFGITQNGVIRPRFFRLRPANFPTIRLSQLARLYASREHLFSEVIQAKTQEELYTLFEVQAAAYWDEHYNFGVPSKKRPKVLTKKFVDLISINTIIPLQWSYAMHQGRDVSDQIMTLAKSISAEKNSVVHTFEQCHVPFRSAMHTQAILHLFHNYCSTKKCLECRIGNAILSQ